MALVGIVERKLWHARQPVKVGPFELFTRMTVIRLSDGGLWVHSPIAPHEALVADLERLGEVKFVVAPNNGHHLHFLRFLEAFPSARGYVSPALAAKRPLLAEAASVGPMAGLWLPELRGYFIQGVPQLDETVWFHPATGTLLLADLLACIGSGRPLPVRLAARLAGVRGSPAMSRSLRLLVRDKAAFARSVEALCALPVERIVLAHEEIVEVDARAKLAAAFRWVKPDR